MWEGGTMLSSRPLLFLPSFFGVAWLRFKKTFAHPSAIWDVLNTEGASRGKDILEQQLKTAVTTHFFDAIVVLPGFNYFPDLQKYYEHDTAKYILLDDNWKEKTDIYVLP